MRFRAILAATVLGALISGCAEKSRPSLSAEARPAPAYGDVVRAWNERADRLSRVWASGVISMNYTDDQGKRRYEQGEAHFQLIQPDRLAVSASKLGETLLWAGCDGQRYWLLEPKEHKRAFVGRHSLASADKVSRLGLPALPVELPSLLGVTPLRLPAPGVEPKLTWSADGTRLELATRSSGGAMLTYSLDPATRLPRSATMERPGDPDSRVEVTLDDDQPVAIPGQAGNLPRFPARISVRRPASNSVLMLSLERMTADPRKLRDQAFDFEALVGALGINEIIDLDASGQTPVVGDAPP